MIPQPRTVHEGARGPDIVAYKGGLVHAGVRPRGLSRSPLFGSRMRDEVRAFQRKHSLQADGVIGPHTYQLLYPDMGSYARELLKIADVQWRARTARERMQGNVLWASQTTLYPFWVYAQIRPYPASTPYRTVDAQHVIRTDCSGFVGIMARWSQAPSPFPSFGFDGLGNTDTMIAELPDVHGTPQLGDLILYSNPGHVVVCIGYPYAVSFGAEPGPIKLDSRYRPHAAFKDFIGGG